jgi:hypothetical protein
VLAWAKAEILKTEMLKCRWAPLEAGFGQVDVALDSAQDFVVDCLFVAQGDDGVAFRLDALAGRDECCAMHSLRSTLFILSALVLTASPLLAQEKKPRVSPHETVNATVGDAKITIVYGRPYTKDPKSGEKRKIWGGLVPYGKVWRMGADEATLFTTDKAISIGGTAVAPGTYSLYLLPAEDGAKLIVNKQTGQWGTKYDESQDLVRIDLKKQTLEKPVDQFTIVVDKTGADGVLKLMWENTQYSAGIAVKQ